VARKEGSIVQKANFPPAPRVLVVVLTVGLLLAVIFLWQSDRRLDDLSDDVEELLPAVSLMADIAFHDLKVDTALLAACSENFAEGSLPCEDFIIEVQKRQFDQDIEDPTALSYIETIKSSDQLLFEGWQEKDRTKWNQGLNLREVAQDLLADVIEANQN
jgi:hypothetical protein